MDQQVTDLVKRTAQFSIRYVAMAGGLMLVLNLLSKIPILGLAFACLYGLGSLAAAIGLGYWIAPKISPLPYGQTKPMLALWIGLGIAIPLTVALIIVSLLGSLFDLLIDRSSFSLIGALFLLIGSLFGGLIGGLVIGTALAWVGSFFSIDRNPSLAGVQGPPSAGRPF